MTVVRTIGRRRLVLTIPPSGDPVPISATNIFTPDFDVHFPSANAAASGYIGDSTVDATWIPRVKGTTFSYAHGDGNLGGMRPSLGFNLAKIFVHTGTAGDTCIIEYMEFDKTES